MHLKQSPGNRVWNHVDGNDLIVKRLEDETFDTYGAVEILERKVAALSSILGALLDTLPDAKAIEVAGLWSWEINPETDDAKAGR
jgi:hypothetical protein